MIGVSYNGISGTANSVADLNALMAKGQGRADGVRAAVQGGGAALLGRRIAAQSKPSAPKPPEIDPIDGPLIGRDAERSLEPDGMVRVRGSKGGWRTPISRTEAKIEFDSERQHDVLVLAKLQYDLVFSEKGLAKERTVERKVWEARFVLASSNGAVGGEYEVRPVWTNLEGDDVPRLAALLFGSGADLKGEIADVEGRENVSRVNVLTHGELT